MNLSQLSPHARFAMAIGASAGVGHVMFQAFTRNLGPVVGLLASVAGIIAIVETTYLILAWSAKLGRVHSPEESAV
jgi:hypothetical protein